MKEKDNKKQGQKVTKAWHKLQWKCEWFCDVFKLGFLQIICKTS